MKNEIIFEPIGGLANRMRVIASGIWLCKAAGKEMKLIWTLNSEMNIAFEEIFEPIESIEIIKKKPSYCFFRSSEQKKFFKKWIIKILNIIFSMKYLIIEDYGAKKILSTETDIETLKKTNKILYFRTCEELSYNYDKYKLFIPKSDIQQRINEVCSNFDKKTIGIHIRRTDHKLAILQSPTELFIQRMYTDLKRDPDINYFLTTDDKETENQLAKLFGNKIRCIEKEFSRKTKLGMKDAVVDFYCLANTSKIYGSYWSSFSYIAARINGIEIENIRLESED